MMRPAPLFSDIARAPAHGAAVWLRTADGVRIRLGFWRGADRGLVVILPGRTEYIEKYGPLASQLTSLGFSVAVIDWRGQGLADRLIPNRALGHVHKFSDYQLDLDAAFDYLDQIFPNTPRYMIAHSMGGCIAYDTLLRRDDIHAAIFCAPMWGIALSTAERIAAKIVTELTRNLSLSHLRTPGSDAKPYVLHAEFENNTLTRDKEMYSFLRTQLEAHPELELSGPTIAWLREALDACDAIKSAPLPKQPFEVFLGTNERIVDLDAIKQKMSNLPAKRLHLIDGAEHEILLETPPVRTMVFETIQRLFKSS